MSNSKRSRKEYFRARYKAMKEGRFIPQRRAKKERKKASGPFYGNQFVGDPNEPQIVREPLVPHRVTWLELSAGSSNS